MRQLIYTTLFTLAGPSLAWAAGMPEQLTSVPCGPGNWDVGAFNDDTGFGFEVWKCADGYHVWDKGNGQYYVNGDGKPCQRNSSTGEEICCPGGAAADNKTKIDGASKLANGEADKDSKPQCTKAPGSNGQEKDIMIVQPKNGGNPLRIWGETDAKDKNVPNGKKKATLRVSGFNPNGTTGDPAADKKQEGGLSFEQDLGKGGRDCFKPASQGGGRPTTGGICQRPESILGGRQCELSEYNKGKFCCSTDGNDQQDCSVPSNTAGTGANPTTVQGASR
jgi:hypothetical protein